MEAPEVTAVQAEGRGEEAVDVGETENLRAPRPHESPLLNPIGLFDKDKVQTSFGYTWQERLFSIGAFEICTSSDRIQSIRNRTLDVFVLNALQATGDTHVFHLFPHEKLLKVEVTATPGVISSVRFVTNLRTSIWFGRHANGALRVFDAPEGHMIHCLYGTEVLEPSELLIARKIDSLDDLAFVQKAKDARTIVVQCDVVVYRLWMLTAEQAEEAKLSLKPHEHWLDLLEGETITKMEAVPFGKGISALRWTTSHRTTPWYGSTSYAKKVVAYTCPDGYHIGGFQGTVQEHGMTSIGALIARLPSTDAPSPPVGEASTEPSVSEQESHETQEKQQNAANMWNLVPKLEWS